MNYIEKLLDGIVVEWKSLGDENFFEIANSARKPVKASSREVGEIPYYGANNIQDYVEGYTHDGEFILIAEDGSRSLENYSIQYVNGKFWANNHVHVVRGKSGLSTRFLYHYLQIVNFIPFLTGGSRAKLTKGKMVEILVPIPCPDNLEKSLEIQSKIVGILDKFSTITAKLIAELNTRKKQYNYYRDQLLSFEEDEVEWKTLLEACHYVDYRGKTPTKTREGVFLVTAKNIRMGYIDYETSQEFISESDYASVMRRGFPKLGDVLITTEAPCGFVAQVDRENIALAQRVIKYSSKDECLSNSFLKYYLLGSQFQNKLQLTATGSTVKGIKGSKLHQLTIPIPSMEKQERIVTILNKFDTFINSLSEGMPREIELRQKQYEYYRNLLLSFPKPHSEAIA
ncbi:restriction endonuclease subunit S [Acinetobacter baumannii]|uniref:restriction endonuclease subunit S n=1 Tax=Acinetobacter baumannii TaxID=470 RepID=UPI0034628F04